MNKRARCAFLAASLCAGLVGTAQVNTDSIVNVAFGTVSRKDLLGGVTTVNVSELINKSYGTGSLDNLSSLVSGYTGNIWGQAGLILVDGVPRRPQDIRMTEVETISVLKGASAVVLYGGNAAKGVVLITTKRGKVKPLSIDVRANTGLFVPKSYPKYLNAADYMTLYNEAYVNDGLATPNSPVYFNQETIDKTRSGSNPYRYPSLDLFSSEYLKKAYSRSDITTEVSGGNERARYYTNMGVYYNNGLLNYGDQKKNNNFGFNVRGNVDMDLTNWLTASTSAVAIIDNSYTGRGDFWGATANRLYDFNRFSPLIPIDMLDPNNAALQTTVQNSLHVIDGKYLLGGLAAANTNAISDMLAAGYIKRRSRTFMYNIGAKADLNGITEGLSFSAGYSMDYNSIYSEAYQLPYATYQPTWSTVDGKDVITGLSKYGNDQASTSEFIGQSTYEQTMSTRAQFNYKRSFSQKHNVTAALLGWWYMSQFSSDPNNEGGSDYHPIRNTNLGFQAGYNFKQKYYIDFTAAAIHSAKLPPSKRNALSPSVTLGWRISDEDFFKNKVAFVDNLKINASYSSIKQDLDITGTRLNGVQTDYYLYQGFYNNNGEVGGWYPWRDGSAGGFTVLSGRGSNPNLTFVTRQEFRAGLDASLLKNLITVDANFFLQDTKGLLSRGNRVYPSFFGGSGSFLPWINANDDRRAGFDFSVNVNKKVGEVQLSLGVAGMYYTSKATRRDEIYQDDYQERQGKDLDAYWGYIAEGFYQSVDDIRNSPVSNLGNELKPGDIKYRDMNNDGIIDSKDQVNLGRNGWGASPFTYGLNLTVKWKNFSLFALGNGQTGAIGMKNSSYFWVRGTNKFSDVVWDRWTEATKATATYPRLTTQAGNNNYQNSTFWMYKNNRFNLNRVQLNYEFKDARFLKGSFIHGLNLYVQGDNLLVLSKERELMETNIGAAPQFRFYNLGLRASF